MLGLFSLAGAAWLVVQSSLLDLETVEVRGARRVSTEEVRERAAVDVGEPLLLIDRGAAAGRVERLPWVRDASVSFSVPGTLVVTVSEREPVGWMRRGDESDAGVALVDGRGRVLEYRAQPSDGLLELRIDADVPAPGRTLQRSQGAVEIARQAPAALRKRVRGIAPAKGGYVLELDAVTLVRFGAPTAIAQKWAALEAVVESLGERRVHLVDVRVPTAPAVREQEHLPPPSTTNRAPPPEDDPPVEPAAAEAPAEAPEET